METNLSKAIDITNDTARYDESVKELLADKQVLARILKYSVEEFAELSLDEIIKSISEPDIAGIRVEPVSYTHQDVYKRQNMSRQRKTRKMK